MDDDGPGGGDDEEEEEWDDDGVVEVEYNATSADADVVLVASARLAASGRRDATAAEAVASGGTLVAGRDEVLSATRP